MKNFYSWDFWKKVLMRAVHTFAETLLGMIGGAMLFSQVDWKYVLGASLFAGFLSILKSIVVGIPEYDITNEGK